MAERMIAEPCFYYRWGEGKSLSIVGIYVDDCRLQCTRPADVKAFRDAWHAKFPSTDPEEDTFLGVKIKQRREVVDGSRWQPDDIWGEVCRQGAHSFQDARLSPL